MTLLHTFRLCFVTILTFRFDSSVLETHGNDDALLVSQTSDILNCEYTIHPQWLLDTPSTNPACWYGTAVSDLASDLDSQPETASSPHIIFENDPRDESGWSEKDKNLLRRGIEIFGKSMGSNVRLSQFMGSKTPSEIKHYLKNYYSEVEIDCNDFNDFDEFIQGNTREPDYDVFDDSEVS